MNDEVVGLSQKVVIKSQKVVIKMPKEELGGPHAIPALDSLQPWLSTPYKQAGQVVLQSGDCTCCLRVVSLVQYLKNPSFRFE